MLVACAVVAASAVATTAKRSAAIDLVEVPVEATARATTPTVHLPIRADLVGATWSGRATAIELRAQGPDRRWSGWVELHAGQDGPDAASREGRAARSARRTVSSPIWVGAADRVQVRAHDGVQPRSLRIVAINATGTATARERFATRAAHSAAWVLGAGQERAEAIPYATGLRTRAAWQAAPPKADPAIAEEGLKGVVIHHTAGTNRYACSQVPAILRGIQRYHMRSNGWNDIGYNFLVDACGGIWEGRAGGATRAVIGAHSSGFNTATAGIALIGNHGVARPTPPARAALNRIVAWRMDVAHVKPTSRMVLEARSGDKFPIGSRVSVRAVSGHRDLFPTSCPGALQYGVLNALAAGAWRHGGAKVANVVATHSFARPDDPLDARVRVVNVRAVASSADVFMRIRLVRISTGTLLHSHGARGFVVRARWEPTLAQSVPAWDIRTVITAARPGQRARPYSAPLMRGPADPGLVVTTPPAKRVAPGGDPADDLIRLRYLLGQDYRLGATLHDRATEGTVATLLAPTYVGATTTPRDLELAVPDHVPEGSYELRMSLPADPLPGRSVRRFELVVDRP